MENLYIDGELFEKMMKGGLHRLRRFESEINDMNVFPVPDGDTGNNMRRTIELGIEKAGNKKSISDYLDGLCYGMLMGARGNSGVILSQIFKGIYGGVKGLEKASAKQFSVALVNAYKVAYGAVLKPAEGTILTVVREGIENTLSYVGDTTSIEQLFKAYIKEMYNTLAKTPEMLPVLKEAGVVDSGGYGFIRIAEGMLGALLGEEIAADIVDIKTDNVGVDLGFFNSKSTFEYGYCMEFLLQLMQEKGEADFDIDEFTAVLNTLGGSIVAIKDDSRVKVHVHTFVPEKIVELARKNGEFLTFKLENMQLQHNEHIERKTEKSVRKDFAMLAVSDGDGFAELYRGQGCDMVLDGGRSMDISVGEFLDAYKKLNAKTVVVFPNDKNVVLAARQAIELQSECTVQILPTTDMAQGYFALASDIPDISAEERISSMKEGFDGVVTLSVVRASKDRTIGGVECKNGEYVAFSSGKLLVCDKDMFVCAQKGLEKIGATEEAEQLIAFAGEELAGKEGEVCEALQSAFQGKSVDAVYGGQTSSALIISII